MSQESDAITVDIARHACEEAFRVLQRASQLVDVEAIPALYQHVALNLLQRAALANAVIYVRRRDGPDAPLPAQGHPIANAVMHAYGRSLLAIPDGAAVARELTEGLNAAMPGVTARSVRVRDLAS